MLYILRNAPQSRDSHLYMETANDMMKLVSHFLNTRKTDRFFIAQWETYLGLL